MKCPKCKSNLHRNIRKGWPTVMDCGNPTCLWVDPDKFTTEWTRLRKQEDIKSIDLEIKRLEELKQFVINQ